MNAKDNEQRPKIKFRGDLYTTARRTNEEVLADDPGWIERALDVHRKIRDRRVQGEGPTPELLEEFQAVAAKYVRANLVCLDGSPFPEDVANDLSPREFSGITAAVQAARPDAWSPGPTALMKETLNGVLEVQ